MIPTRHGLPVLPALLPWLALAWAGLALAASPSDPAPAPTQSNDQTEVSVAVSATTPNRIDQPLNDVTGAGSLTILTQPEITAQHPLTAPEVLRNVPGLSVQESGTVGESAQIRLRGADTFQTLVLMDGLRFNQPFRGAAELGSVLMDGIDQIEVVRGAYSSLYGSEAMGGVVSLRMLPPQRPSEATVFFEGGTFQTFREGVDVGGKGDWGHYRLTVSRTDTDGQFDRDRFGGTTVAAQLRVNLTPDSYVMITPRYQQDKKELAATTVEVLVPTPVVWDDNNRWKQQFASGVMEYHNRVLPRWEVILLAGVVASDLDWDNPLTFTTGVNNGMGNLINIGYAYAEETRERQWTLSLQSNLTWAERQVLTIGLEEGWVDVHSNLHLSATQPPIILDAEVNGRRTTRSLYVQQLSDWTSLLMKDDRVRVQAGVRADGDSQFGTTVNPRVSLSYDLPVTNTTMRLAGGTGYRAPTIQELYFLSPFFGNPGLTPEKSLSGELGLRQPLWHDRLVLDAVYFHINFRDLIERFPPPAHNIATARSRGVETSLTVKPIEAGELTVNYTWFDTHQEAGGPLPFTWRHQLNVAATYAPLLSLLLRADLYAITDQTLPGPFVLQNGVIETESDGYIRLDLTVSYDLIRPVAAVRQVTLYAKATNLFDTAYEEAPGFPAPGQAFLGGIRSSF